MSRFVRYADPLLWSQAGRPFPAQPGACYHFDADAPAGLELVFSSSEKAIPVGPECVLQIPRGERDAALRMRQWRNGPPFDYLRSFAPIAPVGGSAPDTSFHARAGFRIREGGIAPLTGESLGGARPRFEFDFSDRFDRVIPLGAHFSAKDLARARSLVLELDGSTPLWSYDLNGAAPTPNDVFAWHLMRPGESASFKQQTSQGKRIANQFDFTAVGAALLTRQMRFVFSGPFGPLDSVLCYTDSKAGAAFMTVTPSYSLRLSGEYVREAVETSLCNCGAIPLAGSTWGGCVIDSDRGRTLEAGLSFVGVGDSGEIIPLDVGQTYSTAAGYGRGSISQAGSGVVRGGLKTGWRGASGVYLAASGGPMTLNDIWFSYVEGENPNATPAP